MGFFQKIEGAINIENAIECGIPIVRRQTGGKAVLHDKELTYSILISEAHPAMSKSVKDAYLTLSQGLLEGYRNLGIEAKFALPKSKSISKSAVCFEEPSWYELTVDEKKAAGSVQMRKRGVILQHGSVPLTIDKELLFDLFVYPNEHSKEKARNAFQNRAIAINDILPNPIGMEKAKTAFQAGFEKGLDIHLEKFDPPSDLLNEVFELEKKYTSKEWNFLREEKRGFLL